MVNGVPGTMGSSVFSSKNRQRKGVTTDTGREDGVAEVHVPLQFSHSDIPFVLAVDLRETATKNITAGEEDLGRRKWKEGQGYLFYFETAGGKLRGTVPTDTDLRGYNQETVEVPPVERRVQDFDRLVQTAKRSQLQLYKRKEPSRFNERSETVGCREKVLKGTLVWEWPLMTHTGTNQDASTMDAALVEFYIFS